LRPLTASSGSVMAPAFSPDGKQIAFGWDGGTNGAGRDLYVKTMGTDNPLRLTNHPATRLSLAWSADGQNIVIARVAGDSDADVYPIPAAGGPERKLVPTSFESWYGNEISWSPNGKQLAFTDHPPAAPFGTQLLFSLSLDTLERKPVKTDCKLTATPSFSPRGNLLAWVCVDTWSSVSLHVSRMSDGHSERALQGIDGIRGFPGRRTDGESCSVLRGMATSGKRRCLGRTTRKSCPLVMMPRMWQLALRGADLPTCKE